jgi:hypothetical protein
MDEIFGTADLSHVEDVGIAAQKQVDYADEVEHVSPTKV